MEGFELLKAKILDADLCTSCGTCIGVCPVQTLSYNNDKIYNERNCCIRCNLCVGCCPGSDFDYKYFNNVKFNDDKLNKDNLFGSYYHVLAGYSTSFRHSSASGGVITSILVYLLDQHLIDGAIVVVQDHDKPFNFSSTIARTREEIMEAAQSKYLTIPTNKILEEILKEEGKFAYVGLPCQIHGLLKTIDKVPVLKEKIFITIGLFCGFNMTPKATEYLIKKSNIKLNEITALNYRKKDKGKTGFFIQGNNKMFFVPKASFTFLNLFFSPMRCSSCYDYSAEFADISVGDAWERHGGWSRVIVRSLAGEEVLRQMLEKDCIKLEPSSCEDIILSQNSIVNYKKKYFGIRQKLSKQFPVYNISTNPLSLGELFCAVLMLVVNNFCHSIMGRVVVEIIPFSILTYISSKLRNSKK